MGAANPVPAVPLGDAAPLAGGQRCRNGALLTAKNRDTGDLSEMKLEVGLGDASS